MAMESDEKCDYLACSMIMWMVFTSYMCGNFVLHSYFVRHCSKALGTCSNITFLFCKCDKRQ